MHTHRMTGRAGYCKGTTRTYTAATAPVAALRSARLHDARSARDDVLRHSSTSKQVGR
jgi:hypothetical protein